MNRQSDMQKRDRQFAGEELRERLLAGIPLTQRRLQLNSVSTAVLDGGHGPPVVLLHGSGMFAATWMRVIPDLVRTRRVVAPDLPGHGASAVVEGRLDAERVFGWLDELIDQTCASPPTLVGHGLGGAIAARFATRHGDRIRGLVLVDTVGLGPFRPTPRFALAMIPFVARPTEKTRDRLFQQCMVDLDGVREQMGERWQPVEAYALDRARTAGQKAALRSLMPHFGMRAIPPADLARIRVATTLIWGRHDQQMRLSTAEAASVRFGWPLHVIDDAASDPAIEQPEAFLRALHAALAAVTADEATT